MFNNIYNEFNLKIPLGSKGDCFDRFLIRIEEIKESLKILEKLLISIPKGPILSNNLRVIVPSRYQMKNSMEGLINHFKLFTEGIILLKIKFILLLKHQKENLVFDASGR